MTGAWQWRDDALWQSCSDAAHRLADRWIANTTDSLQPALRQLAAAQPLASLTEDDLRECVALAEQLRAISQTLVIIGTGGASLGAQAFCALSPRPSSVQFLENCDPVTMDVFLQLPRETTAWCIISKSGETVETLVSALMLIGHYREKEALLRDRIYVITANAESTLGKIATAQQWPILNHSPTLGGRFSVFSIVGMLPAAYAALNIASINRAAHRTLQQALQQPDTTLWRHAAWIAANAAEKPMQVLMAYADRLRPATQWFKQLWAESLGKDGKGQTPVTAIGAIDQHSQLQLYLDGPRDKLLTLWLPDAHYPLPPLATVNVAGAEFLDNRSVSDVMRATAEATATTLQKAGLPVRVLYGSLTPESLAQWMMWQMLETLAVAHLLGVDPYSQPAVEGGKQLTRAALTAGG